MVIRLGVGERGFILTNPNNVSGIDCPNRYSGIGDITLRGDFWTGDTWLHSNHAFCFSFGSITEIKTRNNLDESEEEWNLVWSSPECFSYEPWFVAADILRKFKG